MNRYRRLARLLALLFVATVGANAAAQWVQFADETATRLAIEDPSLGASDLEEKDYATGDFDQDGDIDLVVVRKEPHITAGKRRNLLLINENGVLTDRTEEFASTSDVPGDLGFLTPTNDRDVQVVDIDLDGWLDLVTAATISPGEPKHIGHPRVYRNLGCSGDCNGTADWLGFRHEDARIPTMLSWSGQPGHNPCACHMGVGDVTGDDYPDLFLVDYNIGCEQPGADFNSRLLINQGAANPGHFADETLDRFFGSVGGHPFPVQVDALSGYIVDLDGDGTNDILHEYEGFFDVAYNDAVGQGVFDTYDIVPAAATYFMNVADLNNDDLLDVITTDDDADRYYLNQGTGPDDMVDFLSFTYSFSHSGVGGPASDDGFGDDTVAADLDNDGWLDVLTADVDFEFAGCGRRAHIYHNLGGQVGGFVSLQEQTTGAGCQTLLGNPSSCLVASIPADKLVGTHDIAIFDINGDQWLDLVIGRCTGTEVWINQPAVGPAGGVPDGQTVAGEQLVLDKSGDGQVVLSWGASCAFGDSDYSIYGGPLAPGGDFKQHAQVTCSTDGSTTDELVPAADSTYYLVVPHNGTYEGSYGRTSGGSERPQGVSSCRPINAAACE